MWIRWLLFAAVLLPCLLDRGMAISFVRGDCNGDETVDLTDAVLILDYLFADGSTDCEDALDVNDTGAITISDAFHIVCWLFCGGTPTTPASPYPDCGVDTTADGLSCLASSCPLAPPGMVLIPGGVFQVGRQVGIGDADELPVHSVEAVSYTHLTLPTILRV